MALIFIKSFFEAECRRFSIQPSDYQTFEQFCGFLELMHKLQNIQFVISYVDPRDDDILPINNNDNHARALLTAKSLLRIIIRRKLDDSTQELALFRSKNNFITSILGRASNKSKNQPSISNPQDFRQVSAIIDVDVVPESWRRVRLLKHGTDRPLGFYIRDGISVKVTQFGLEKIPSIFISRLMPGGLAESTGLLAVDDEIIEVNGIEVANKTLDQVTDMMVANSSNLIITVKPANQRATLGQRRGSVSRIFKVSADSTQSTVTNNNTSGEEDDRDEIINFA